MRIKLFEAFVNEEDAYYAANRKMLYRNTSIKWLIEFLNKGSALPYGSEERFISFSKEEDSGGQDDYGDVLIIFNANMLYAQGAIEVEYYEEFFEEHPDICQYVTGYKNEKDYYKNAGYKSKEDFEKNGQNDVDTLSWETTIEDYAEEAEVVIKKLKLEKGLIIGVVIPKKTKKADLQVIQSKGIPAELK